MIADAIVLVLAFFAMAWLEGLPLVRQGHKREAFIFAVVWLIAIAYALPLTFGIQMPNPVTLLEYVFRPILPLP